MTKKSLWWLVAGVVAIGGAGLLATNLAPAKDAALSLAPDDTSALAFQEGDQLTYRVGGSAQGTMELRVLAPRAIAGPDLVKEAALPVLLRVRAGGSEVVTAEALALGSGGVVLLGDACLVEATIGCDSAFASWQACPMVGFLGTASLVRAGDIEGSAWSATDPLTGRTWTYAVEAAGRGRTRLTLADEAPQQRACFAPLAMEFDVRARTLASITMRDGAILTLDTREPGRGERISFGATALSEDRLVPADRTRSDPYPPGAGELGVASWTLARAWDHAVKNAPELSRFLRAHPNAFVLSAAERTSATDVAGGLDTSEREWSIKVIAPSRAMIEVSARRTIAAGIPKESSTATEVAPPADVPVRFSSPPATAADLREFVRAAAAFGLRPVAREAGGSFEGTLALDEPAAFVYSLTLAEENPNGQGLVGAVSTAWITLDAATGRLSSAVLPPDEARALLVGP